MNSTIKIVLYLFFTLVVCTNSFAQIEEDHSNDITELLNYESPFSTMLLQTTSNQKPPAVQNEVFILQVGTGNSINSKLVSTNSNTNYIQNGDFNEIDTQVTAEIVQQNIFQQGNSNTVVDFSGAPSAETSLNVSQNGNNSDFVNYGSNSISNDLQFKMSGDSQTIIVKNYN